MTDGTAVVDDGLSTGVQEPTDMWLGLQGDELKTTLAAFRF